MAHPTRILEIPFSLWRFLFARPFWYWLNLGLFHLALRGMGILNYTSTSASGESHLWSYIQQKIKPKLIIDVGVFSAECIQEIATKFPKATIYAFEPHPKNYVKISKYRFPSRIQVFNLGMSNQKTQAKLWDYSNHSGTSHASLYQEVFSSIHHQAAKARRVKLTTLDSFAEQKRIKQIDFLKIDTEGHELQVLEGAKKLLRGKAIKCIQFEFNAMHALSRTFLADIIKLLSDYECYRLLPTGLLPLTEYEPLTFEIFAYQNIIAIRKDLRKIWFQATQYP